MRSNKIKSQKIIKKLGCLLLIGLTISCKSQKKELTSEQKAIINQAKKNFVFVEGGTFIMGEKSTPIAPEHEVTLSSYSISKYETTWQEYDLYHILNGMDIVKPDYRGKVKEYDPKFGAKQVSWYTAQAYCKWLGEQLNLPLDLPTEAQWEYAARSRGQRVFHATNNGKADSGKLIEQNYGYEEVGKYPPNPLGVYDMTGGRPEWTNDFMWAYKGPVTNPRFDTIDINKEKVVRGFHNLYNSTYLRGSRKPEFIGSEIGFRCVCNQETPIE